MSTSAPLEPWSWRPAVASCSVQPVALLQLEGADALRFLHGQSSQAIASAAAGSCLATCLISPTARMRALAQVLVASSGAWLLIEAGDAEAVRTALDRVLFPADRVTLGPLREALLITPVPAGEAPLPAIAAGSWQRTSGESDGEIWQLGERLLLTGAAQSKPHPLAGLPVLTPVEQERWRIQQGWPSAPGELNDNTNPFELGLAARVSLNKGCYVGQETLAKLATYDGVKQQLRRWWALTGPEDPPLQSGQNLQSANGERAGVITSALALHHGDGSVLWLGLALVRRQALTQSWLQAGNTAAAAQLQLSMPEAFVEPPVGAGQQPS